MPPIRILVTGFGPYPDVPYNASATLAAEVAKVRLSPNISLFAEVVPVIWADARIIARDVIAKVQPDAVLHFGVSKKLSKIEIETRAFNMSGQKEDQAGVVRPVKRLLPSGEHILPATLPPLPLLKALRENGFPAELSHDAGRYLCNALFYWSLADASLGGPLIGFFHIPAAGTETAAPSRLTQQQVADAACVLVRASAKAVLRARKNRNRAREESGNDGSPALYGNRRGSRRAFRSRSS